MGEANRRRDFRIGATVDPTKAQAIIQRVSEQILSDFILPNNFRGSCYYTSLALKYGLREYYNVDVESILGFVRYDGIAWASHMWVEYAQQKTDLAIGFPLPPVLPGPVLINGTAVQPGEVNILYSRDIPTDGMPVALQQNDGQQSRRQAEHAKMKHLSLAGQHQLLGYLQAAPNGMWSILSAILQAN